jgi:hypothetical protein
MRRGRVTLSVLLEVADEWAIILFRMNARLNLGTLLAEAAQRFAAREAFPGISYRKFLADAHRVRDTLSRAGLAASEPVHVRISNQPRT